MPTLTKRATDLFRRLRSRLRRAITRRRSPRRSPPRAGLTRRNNLAARGVNTAPVIARPPSPAKKSVSPVRAAGKTPPVKGSTLRRASATRHASPRVAGHSVRSFWRTLDDEEMEGQLESYGSKRRLVEANLRRAGVHV